MADWCMTVSPLNTDSYFSVQSLDNTDHLMGLDKAAVSVIKKFIFIKKKDKNTAEQNMRSLKFNFYPSIAPF